MDTQYDMQWIQHEHDTVVIKNVDELMQADEQNSSSSVLQDDEYVADSADVDTSNIDQIAAENLIFMARDGQVVTEIISSADETQAVVDVADGESISDEYVYAPTAMDEYDEDTTPQMVTEEVITDDWVQRQGAERVEVSAEQIIGSSSQVIPDVEVPLPTVQDEYTALRPYPCDFCSRRFRKKASLMNHMVAHQNDRPNLCKLCGSRFFRRSDLISHLKAHADAPEIEGNEQVDLGGFAIEVQKPENSHEDQYYDYDEYIQANSKNNNRESNKIFNGNSNNCSSATTMRRTGRISRLKPKKEIFSLEMAEDIKHVPLIQHTIETNCQELQASNAQVQFTPDKQNQTQFYPITDDCKPFVCQQCGLSFAREKALSAHIKNHRNEAPLECDQCNEMFWDKDALQEHQKIHQFEASNSEYDPEEVNEETQSDSEIEQMFGEYYCNECGISFHRQDLLKRHARTHTHPNEVIESLDKSDQHCCNTCGETFEEALDLLAHAEIHARYPPFKCTLCGESFFEEATIKRHLLTQHENVMTVNSCILCGKECRDRKALIKHAWDHSREKFHSCSKCGKSFHNKARLKRHMISHRDKSVTCNICFEEFPDGRSLSNHRHSHSTTTSIKMFPCLECGKTFGSRSSQQIHVRIHTGEKPYGCRYCWKAFADGGTLRKHERIHTGEKPYVCSVCSRAFNQRVVLREHIRSHHSGLDYKRGTYFCPLCEESLPSSPDLVQHLIQHSDVNTAKQRKPITGPRKYKRRRKLKPHELERLKSEISKHNTDGNNSDVDITDIDMDNVDDLLAMTEESPTLPTNKRNKATKINKNETLKRNLKTDAYNTSESCIVVDDVPSLSRTRYHSTNGNSDKLWPSKLNNDESLLLNVENTLQSLDTLVVGHKYTDSSRKSQAQRTRQVQLKRTNERTIESLECTTRTRRKTQTQTAKAATQQPSNMMHTKKRLTTQLNNGDYINENSNSCRQQRTTATTATSSKTLLTNDHEPSTDISNSFNTLLPSKTLTIVDDYEIISPDTKPPHQISSSPIHIKHEVTEQQQQTHYRQSQFQQHKQHLLQSTNSEQRRRRRHLTSQSSQTSRSSDLYDAQLLLDAATLRKDCYEKFNPSIVQDLEEILRSPLKNEKIGERMRNNSECSTPQFISDHLEEEAALIKIEPNSPDFQSLFNCTPSGGGGAASSANNSNLHKTPERTRTTTTKKNRQVTPNRRYLDFETLPTTTTSSTSSARRQSITKKLKRSVRSNASSTKSMEETTSPTHNFTSTTTTYQHNDTVNNSCSSSLSNSYDSMSTIDSAAAAVHAAEAAATNSKLQCNKFYFECEMCSMVFADRAQLLDHVPIHI